MNNFDKYWWIPLIAMCIGMGLPTLLTDFEEESFKWRIQMGIFTSMAMLTYALFNKFGEIYPELRTWANRTLLGATVAIFLGSLLVSTAAAFFAMLPLPNWLHFGLATVVALFSLVLLLQSGESGENE